MSCHHHNRHRYRFKYRGQVVGLGRVNGNRRLPERKMVVKLRNGKLLVSTFAGRHPPEEGNIVKFDLRGIIWNKKGTVGRSNSIYECVINLAKSKKSRV